MVFHLHVGGQVIRTTPEHPYYVQDQGWTAAGELEIGDLIATQAAGGWVAVEDVLDTGQVETVYNFRVADYHTYFVGSTHWGFSVWVHNTYFKQVGYLRNDLSRIARNHRQSLENPLSGVNIAVIEYRTRSNRLLRKVIESNGQHSERRLLEALPDYVKADRSRIRRIYSELEPCGPDYHNCDAFLRKMAPDATVTYSFKYRDPADRVTEGMPALLKAVRRAYGS